MKFSQKLGVLVLCAALLSAALIASFSYGKIRRNVIEGYVARTETSQLLRINGFKAKMDTLAQDMRFQGGHLFTRMALQDFAIAFNTLALADHGGGKRKLRDLYITRNAKEDKSALDDAKDGTLYSQLHRKYHPTLRRFVQERKYADLLLISPDGDVLYSVAKEPEFSTNLDGEPWKDSALAKLFHEARESGKAGEIFLSSIGKDEISGRAPTAFVATPVVNDNGTLAGVLLLRLSAARLFEDVVAPSAGEGRVRHYVAGPDFAFFPGAGGRAVFRAGEPEEGPDRLVAEGKQGMMNYRTGEGNELFAVYRPVTFRQWRWGIVSTAPSAEILGQAAMGKTQILAVAALIQGLVALWLFWYLRRRISQPVMVLASYLNRLSQGDKAFLVSGLERQDEIGELSRAVQASKESALKAEMASLQQRRHHEPETPEPPARNDKLEELVNVFDGRSSRSLLTVSTAAKQMSVAAAAMVDVAGKTSRTSETVAGSIERMFGNVKAVASAAEQLSTAINDISSQVSRSAEISREAVDKTQGADVTIQKLSHATQKIGDVVNLISDIADQINLLALNATIESARAGEAGKGFAVVASEVKNLASETTRATEDIGAQIAEIQNVAGEVVQVITEIRGTISEMRGISTTIASAVEQQGAATKDIARHIQTAAEGVSHVSGNIGEVHRKSLETDKAASQVLEVANLFSRQSEALKEQVEGFVKRIREGA